MTMKQSKPERQNHFKTKNETTEAGRNDNPAPTGEFEQPIKSLQNKLSAVPVPNDSAN